MNISSWLIGLLSIMLFVLIGNKIQILFACGIFLLAVVLDEDKRFVKDERC